MCIEYYENYGFLANAIIVQAVKDYRCADTAAVRNEVKRFFLSEWFHELTNIDGQTLINRLEEERRKRRKAEKGGHECAGIQNS